MGDKPELTAHITLGYQRQFTERSPYFYKVSGGAWSDRAHKVRLSSLFSIETGIRIGEASGFYGTATTGVARVGQTNSQISTKFQFQQAASLGWADSNGAAMGVFLKHLSNAGIRLPNFGYNIVGLEVTLPLSY